MRRSSGRHGLIGKGLRGRSGKRPNQRQLTFEPLEARRLLALVTVTNTLDVVNGNVASIADLMSDDGGDGISLREAIEAANAFEDPDEVQFDAALTAGGPAMITLSLGELLIASELTITGPGANLLTIDATGNDPTPIVDDGLGSRVFNVDDQSYLTSNPVSLSGLTITGGDVNGPGGGILNAEDLTVDGLYIRVNSSESEGGAIANSDGQLRVTASTISGNAAPTGGGIYNNRTGYIINSTIIGNAALVGGGVYTGFDGFARIRHSTITANLAEVNAGSGVRSMAGTEVYSTIIAENFGDDDVSGSFVTLGFNLIGGGSGTLFFQPTEIGFTNLALGGLTDNGGPTPTIAPAQGGPAIDGGDQLFAPPPTTDQRGFPRVQGARIDVGAFEASDGNSEPQVPNPGPQNAVEGTAFSLAGLFDFTDADLTDTHTARVDWGDGSAVESLVVVEDNGGGSLDGSHVFADDGDYVVVVTVFDNQGGDDIESFTVTVGNLAPALNAIGNQSAAVGVPFSLAGLAAFSDPGFDNPLNPNVSGGSQESFRYFVDWGDGQPTETGDVADLNGGPGVPSTGSLVNEHTYFSQSLFLVTVRLADDDMTGDFASGVSGVDFVERTFQVEVEPPPSPQTFVVDTLVDEFDGDISPGDLSLREAIQLANLNVGLADTINFAPALTTGGPATILLTQGQLLITDSVTINGPDAALLAIDASGNDPTPTINNGDGTRIFEINDSGNVFFASSIIVLRGLTLTGGDAGFFFAGGAITNADFLTIEDCIITNNASQGSGGAINSFVGDVSIIRSTISGNSAGGDGAAIAVLNDELVITDSTISGNTASRHGGGISASNVVTITRSSITGNTAAEDGGGIIAHYGAAVTVADSTIAGNSAARGGGMFNDASSIVTLTNSTVSGNSAVTSGGGLAIDSSSGQTITISHSTITLNTADSNNDNEGSGGGIFAGGAGTIALNNTIIAGNFDNSDAAPDLDLVSNPPFDADLRFNLVGINTGSGLVEAQTPDANGNLVGTGVASIDPLLAGFDSFGGPTQTHALIVGSPAINAGDPRAVAGVEDVPRFDQRGDPFGRVSGARVDMGAFEVPLPGPASLIVDTSLDENDGDFSPGDLSLREAIMFANERVGAEAITFAPALTAGGPATIVLTLGELRITDSVTIDGPGANLLTVDASGNDLTPDSTYDDGNPLNDADGSRVFNINDGNSANFIDVAISGLMLTGGDVGSGGGSGGGVSNSENLTIARSTITGNFSDFYGGGIRNYIGNLVVTASTISGNSAAAVGGGIESDSGYVTVLESTISGNSAGFDGGGIGFSNGDLTVINSTISGNSAGSFGGGITNYGVAVIRHSTITNNTAPAGYGSGVHSSGYASGPGVLTQTVVESSIIAGNNGTDVDFTPGGTNSFQSDGYNLVGTGNALGAFDINDLTGVTNPMLGLLADNGGPTATHALLAGSPALDAGDPLAEAGVAEVPLFDQRGRPFSRRSGGRIDMGSEEAQSLSLVVDTLADEDDKDYSPGDLSLREALRLTNTNNGPDTITFAPALTANGPETILLVLGQLPIRDPVTITGPGANLLTIDASGNDPTPLVNNGDGSRVFDVDDDNAARVDVIISGLTITGGDVNGSGGGIRNIENLAILNCVIVGNHSDGDTGGGGIRNFGGNLTITNSTVSGNTAEGRGGGVYGSGNMLVDRSTISANTADIEGGGFFTHNDAILFLGSSTVSGNSSAGSGGGISHGGSDLRLVRSTVTNNRADSDANGVGAGGGFDVRSSVGLTLDHAIVAGNFGASAGPDISIATLPTAMTVVRSLVGTNAGTPFVETLPDRPDANGNFIGSAASPIDPLLAPLADIGGPTLTHEPLAGSPAINGGDPNFQPPPEFDQRGSGFPRVAFGRVDMGAVEFDGPIPDNFVVDIADDELDGNFAPGDLSLREALWASNLDPEVRTITFAGNLAGATILLVRGELAITDDVTIDGLGASLLTVDASGNDPTPDSTMNDGDDTNDLDGSRLFDIDRENDFISVQITGLTLMGGDMLGQGGAILNREGLVLIDTVVTGNRADGGGGIFNDGSLAIAGSTVIGNETGNSGGGITNQRELVIASSMISGNFAEFFGGGIYNFQTSTGGAAVIEITASTISNNTANRNGVGAGGGGVANLTGHVEMLDTTISGNMTGDGDQNGDGGGILNVFGTLTVAFSTVSGNTADGRGGGISSNGGMSIESSTISGNSALSSGGGLAIFAPGGETIAITQSTITANTADFDNDDVGSGGGIFATDAGALEIGHTIIAGNFDNSDTAPDLDLLTDPPSAADLIFSLLGDNTGSGFDEAQTPDTAGNLIGDPDGNGVIDALLASLADNGGPTETHALSVGSPAIDAGDPNFAPPPDFDQRGTGFPRVNRGRVDMGAFEFSNADPMITSLTFPPEVFENQTLQLDGTYSDSDALDTHELDVDWDGNGTFDETFAVTGGSFSVLHLYLDDNPIATASDPVNIGVRLRDAAGGIDSAVVPITVLNVAPMLANLSATNVNENGVTTFNGNIVDAGTLDTFTLEIDWGDGTIETFTYGPGTISFSETHRYLDDNPSGTPSDEFGILATVADDDSTGGIIFPVGVVSRWSAEGNANDSVDGNNGTLQGGVTFGPGRTGQGFVFDGVSGRVSVGNPATLNFGTGPFSLEAWFNWDGGGSSIGNIIRKSDFPIIGPAVGYWLRIDRNSSTLSFFAGESPGSFGEITTPITPNVLHHVVATRDSSGLMSLYVDGELRTTFTAPNANTTGPATFTIGAWDDRFGITELFSGTIDEVAVYDHALTVANVEPMLANLSATDVSENGITTLTGSIVDPGTLDTFTLEVDWGDGSADFFTYGAGVASFSETHQYRDDNPAGTLSDTRVITVTLTDDDTGEDTETTSLVISNLPPSLDALSITTPITVGGTATLTGSYSDVGTLDTHTLEIDWDTGSTVDAIETVTVAGGTFSIEHVYATAGTFTVTATLVDDDGGRDTEARVIDVIVQIPPAVDLNGAEPGVDYIVSSPAGAAVDIGAFGRTLIQDDDSDMLSRVEVRLTFPIGGTSGTLDVDESVLLSSIMVERTAGPTLILEAVGGTAPLDAFQQALETLVYQPTSGGSATAVTIEVTVFDDELLASNAAEAQITFVAVDPDEPTDRIDPPIETPPEPPLVAEDPPSTNVAPDARPGIFIIPESDAGSGGQYLAGYDADTESPADVLAADRALQMVLSNSRVPRQEEVIDAVYTLGDVELVSLLGIDMGDEPVLQKRRTAKKVVLVTNESDPQPALPADPIVAAAVSESSTLAFWSALAGGALTIGGGLCWYGWRRRRTMIRRDAG